MVAHLTNKAMPINYLFHGSGEYTVSISGCASYVGGAAAACTKLYVNISFLQHHGQFN